MVIPAGQGRLTDLILTYLKTIITSSRKLGVEDEALRENPGPAVGGEQHPPQ